MKGRSGDIGTCMSSSRKVDVWVVLSQVCGIGYFAAWSISFYPQLILNYRRKQFVSPESTTLTSQYSRSFTRFRLPQPAWVPRVDDMVMGHVFYPTRSGSICPTT